MSDPPRPASWLLDLFVPADQADSIPGDLLEEFTAKAAVSPRSARWWYRRQVLRTVGHLLHLEFRRSVWATIGAVIAGLVMLHYSARLVHLAAGTLLEHFEVYRYVSAKIVWLIYFVGLESIACPLIAGWTAAAVSKGREMAVAVLLGVLRGTSLLPALYFALWWRPPQAAHLLRHPVPLLGWFLLQLWPAIGLFLGSVICRTHRVPQRPAPAVT